MVNKAAVAEKVVNPELTLRAIAKAVADGDVVNFRFLFGPFSPARRDSTEHFETEKYAYLLPEDAEAGMSVFREAMELARREDVWDHIQRELEAGRPARLPSVLLLMLADNAVRLGKYTSASQAYELLRMRRRTQQQFLDQADKALDAGDVSCAVRGYLIGAGLAYDYAAFPDPLPLAPNYQTEALKLHGEYPVRPEDSVALFEPEAHVNKALEFLLYDAESAGRLLGRPFETRLAFLKELVKQIDPAWPEFVRRYHEACTLITELGQGLQRQAAGVRQGGNGLAEEIREQRQRLAPAEIMVRLLGRKIENGEWWEYLKELAYEHPASVLFISRQAVGDMEILMPRLRAESATPRALGLDPGSTGHSMDGHNSGRA